MSYMNNLNSMYRDPTEVPSYGLGSLLGNIASGVGKVASGIGSTLSNAATNVGNAFTSAGAGNFGNALGSLYTGVDNLVGGILPGGQAFGQGYLGQLYTGADKMLGGYLPNIGGGAAAGGAGYTPQYMSAQRAFDALPGPASANPAMVGTSLKGGPVTYEPINTAASGGGFKGAINRGLDNLGKVSNVLNPALAIYDATRETPTQQSVRNMQILNPGMGSGAPQMITAGDPAAGGAPGLVSAPATAAVGGGAVPTTMEATGGQSLSEVTTADLIESNQELMDKIDDFMKNKDGAPNKDREDRVGKEARSDGISTMN